MKIFIKSFMSLLLMMLVFVVAAIAQASDVAVNEDARTFLEILTDNWKIIGLSLIPLIEIIVRLTPTKRDDTFLTWFFSIFPNFKKGGGVHNK